MGLAVLVVIILVLLISYKLYISPAVKRNINPDSKRSPPARRQMDGVDFFPTRFRILTGFQLRSISLDVIIAPVIAVQFGWLPAILWLIFGAVFFGWAHDYLSTMISVRSSGKPFTQLFDQMFNQKSRSLIYWFLLFYLLIIISQFSLLLSSLLGRVDIPFAIIFLVLVSLLSGILIYRTRLNLVLISLIALAFAVLGIWFGFTNQIRDGIGQVNYFIGEQGMTDSLESIFGGITLQTIFYLIMVFIICYLGASLPTWRFAVPFNYLTNWLVVIGFTIAIIGLILGTLRGSISSSFEIPPVVTAYQPHIGPLWPILFVTLSSGTISGWHSLVSSFTTSHQVEKEPIVKPVTTKGMFGETIMVAIIIIFAAIFGVSSGIFNLDGNYMLVSGPASVFATGFAKTWNAVGVSQTVGASISAILLTLMGLSVLHLAVRYARDIQSELFGGGIPLFKNQHISTIIVLIVSMLLILIGLREWLWILFAGANQLLAALVLMFATIWLAKQNKSIWWTFIPSIFIFITGLAAIIYSSVYQPFLKAILFTQDIPNQISPESILLLIFGIFFSVTSVYIFIIGLGKLHRIKLSGSLS